MKTDYFDKAAQQFANLMSDINDREDPASRGQLAKALDHHCGDVYKRQIQYGDYFCFAHKFSFLNGCHVRKYSQNTNILKD